MILKKTLVTSTCLIFSAILLSQVYSFQSQRFASNHIDVSAFGNLMSNVKSITETTNEVRSETENTEVTRNIINVIDDEITSKIKHSKKIMAHLKTKSVEKLIVTENKNAEKIELLTEFEINNKEMIELQAIPAETFEYSTFSSIKLADSYNEEIKDEVLVEQASTEAIEKKEILADEVKTTQHEVVKEVESIEKDDEIVVFDYSKTKPETIEGKSIDQKLYERPLSNVVKNAISREMGSAPIKKLEVMDIQNDYSKSNTKIENDQIDLNSEDNIVYDYTKTTTQEKVSTQEEQINAFANQAEMSTHETRFAIAAKEINLTTQKIKQGYSYEFIPDYDRAERSDDKSSGVIQLAYSLSGEMNTQTGVIQSSGMIPTRVELNLGSANALEVPLLNEEGMQKFLVRQNIFSEGNLILIGLNSNVLDVEIDSQFTHKLYFNKSFKLQAAIGGASYVLFLGVKTGNVLTRYQLANKESAQKIVYVGDGEMYFEDPSFTESKREMYNFTTRNLMGQKKKELIIDGSAISFFNTKINAKKKALNAYEIKVPVLATGMRKYLEFKHLSDSIFVGSSDDFDIEIPGNDFIGKAMEVNQVSSLKEQCMVQVNLSKDLRDLKVSGKNRSGEMFVEKTFLDKDGNFSRDNFENADKAFIVGDMEGQFNLKLDYTDGSSEFLKTFCSEGTYLVEQL